MARLDRLGQEIVAAHRDRVEAPVQILLARQEHDGQEGAAGFGAYGLRDFDAVGVGQIEIQQHQIRMERMHGLGHAGRVGADARGDATMMQYRFAELGLGRIVLDDKHAVAEAAPLFEHFLDAREDRDRIAAGHDRVGAGALRIQHAGQIGRLRQHQADRRIALRIARARHGFEQAVQLRHERVVDEQHVGRALGHRELQRRQGLERPHEKALRTQGRRQRIDDALGRGEIVHLTAHAAGRRAPGRARRRLGRRGGRRGQAVDEAAERSTLYGTGNRAGLDEGTQKDDELQGRHGDVGQLLRLGFGVDLFQLFVEQACLGAVPALAEADPPVGDEGIQALAQRALTGRRAARRLGFGHGIDHEIVITPE